MKKILVLANNDIGLYNFRKEILKGFIDKGYEVHISLPNGERVDDLQKMGCIYHETLIDRRGMNPIKDSRLFLRYVKLFRKVKPDLVLTYTIKPNVYGGMVARLTKKPYVVNITGIGSAFHKDGLIKKIMIKMYQIATKKADVLFFQNEENQEVFLENNIKGNEAILLPGSGVNLTDYSFYPLDQTKDNIEFLFIGRVMREKGIDEYIYAAQEGQKNKLNCVFHVIGDIEEEIYAQKLADLHEAGTINYHGFHKNVQSYIEQSDCIVLPSYHEGMSNTLLEGAASGRPLIASNISGCKEAIDDGMNGYRVEKGNAEDLYEKIKKFVSLSFEDRQAMGQYSRVKIEKTFDRRLIVKKYQEIVFQLIGGSSND